MNSEIFFWTHFALVTVSHFFVGVLAVYTVHHFFRSNRSLLDRLAKVAIIFFLTVLGVNHITSSRSPCILTTLESKARVKEGKSPVKDFLPRYYEVFSTRRGPACEG